MNKILKRLLTGVLTLATVFITTVRSVMYVPD